MSDSVNEIPADVPPEPKGLEYFHGGRRFLVIDGGLAESRRPQFFDFLRRMSVDELRALDQRLNHLEREISEARE